MRLAAAGLALLLPCLPLLLSSSPAAVACAGLSAALALAGVGLHVIPLVVAGASLAWLEYGITLSASAAGVGVINSVALGTVSFLLLQTADFSARFRAVALPRRAIVSQVRWWLMFCAIVAVLVIVAALVGLVLARPMPGPVTVAMALVAAAVTAAGIARMQR